MTDEWRPTILSGEEAMRMAFAKQRPEGVGEDDSVMISDDMRLKDGLLADRDRAIFQELREGGGVPLNDPAISGPTEVDPENEGGLETVRKLVGLYGERDQKTEQRVLKENLLERHDRLKFWVDAEVARFIRYLRVEKRGTWRYVAGAVADKYGTDWGEDQIFGMMLCQIAAEREGANYMEGEWN